MYSLGSDHLSLSIKCNWHYRKIRHFQSKIIYSMATTYMVNRISSPVSELDSSVLWYWTCRVVCTTCTYTSSSTTTAPPPPREARRSAAGKARQVMRIHEGHRNSLHQDDEDVDDYRIGITAAALRRTRWSMSSGGYLYIYI